MCCPEFCSRPCRSKQSFVLRGIEPLIPALCTPAPGPVCRGTGALAHASARQPLWRSDGTDAGASGSRDGAAWARGRELGPRQHERRDAAVPLRR